MKAEDVLELEDWVTLAEAADRMKLSPNGVRKRVFDYDEFAPEDVRKISIGGNVIFLLRWSRVQQAVDVELREREDWQNNRRPLIERRKAKQDQRKRILTWASTSGFEAQTGFAVPTMGRLSNALLSAYVEATGDALIE